MYSVEGVKMLLPQGSFARFYYLFRQLQRILPLMHLAVRERKLKWLSSDNLRPYRGDGISMCRSSLSASPLRLAFRLKVNGDWNIALR